MDNILPPHFSNPPADPNRNSSAAVLVSDSRSAYEAWSDALVQDPAWYSADAIAQQASILEFELEAELTAELAAGRFEQITARTEQSEPEGRAEHEEFEVGESLLPGFETLTWADLDQAARSSVRGTVPNDCTVGWCVHQGLPVHTDGFDADPDQGPHRSVEHTIRAIHGGESIDHAGHAEVTVQLEQDHDQQAGPTVTLAVVVRGIEQYTWLTLPETRALQHALTHLLTEAQAEAGAEAESS